MLYHRRPDWWLPDAAATPESAYLNRRQLLAGAGAGALLGAIGLPKAGHAAVAESPFTPMPATHPEYADAGRPVTAEDVNAAYNNFYEFGSSKKIARAAQALESDPWVLEIDGLVDTPLSIDVDDLMKRVTPEERIYRHRCVEAWSMVVPWIGLPLRDVLALAAPQSGARYVRFETFLDPAQAPGQKQHWYPWPYVEGLTIEEAQNELPLLVVGAYGKILHKQFGAPIRLHVPWKYGFKSIKSIKRITLTDERPVSFWEELAAQEYGFWANVNPEVPHPRWSQATERVLGGDDEEIPTALYNGYGDQVAHLYKDMGDLHVQSLWR
ncbi:protein-methionine-sulfoxide reductase catalytic subunit MsrP [Oceanomicrobium pacificus]|uniref:Protein-methionine-sulfoxide reductase catalytic subunit MsrP n=1 Tax=Oceanomicrobium pacificus TaxID=2692916 RepID=A0A6B0TVE2_9RHOB|nr:protein-methionine-sulfoxide reductase catalytic subunit MsrP [Oceanomicrobium pacificus]MXU65745.1 protein-methionine-sulfoxide reductase catalytic subunit MsrP [Oceanomicrobium pacificus]